VSWAIYSAQAKDRTVEQLTMCFTTRLPEGRQLRNEFPSSLIHGHRSTASRAGLRLGWGTMSITSSLDFPMQGRAGVCNDANLKTKRGLQRPRLYTCLIRGPWLLLTPPAQMRLDADKQC